MSSNEVQFTHEEVMQEEGLSYNDLPKEIQKMISGFNILKKRWKANQNERDLLTLNKQTIKIGDMIIDYIESDFDDDNDDDDDDEKSTDDKKSQSDKDSDENKSNKSDNQKQQDNKAGNEKQKPAKSGTFGNLMMEKKILAIMQSRGEKRIKISDLESIIGRDADYPEQVVHNIKLRKVFLSSDYRLA